MLVAQVIQRAKSDVRTATGRRAQATLGVKRRSGMWQVTVEVEAGQGGEIPAVYELEYDGEGNLKTVGPAWAAEPKRRPARTVLRASRREGSREPAAAYAYYVYGVVGPNALELALRGVEAQAVFPLPVASLMAVASRVPLSSFGRDALPQRLQDPAWVSAVARSHHQLLLQVMETTTIVPFPFGTVFFSWDAVAQVVTEREDEFRLLLKDLAGREEWEVRVEGDGTDEDRSRALGRQVYSELSTVSEQARYLGPSALAPPEEGDPWLRAVYLVGRGQRGRWQQALDQARNLAGGLTLVCTGPWPPYHFCE